MPELPPAAQLLPFADASRKRARKRVQPQTQSDLGQYMTPPNVAAFMASLFPTPLGEEGQEIRLLDPGAGVGMLTSAFLDRLAQEPAPRQIAVDACEIDPAMRGFLAHNLDQAAQNLQERGCQLSWRILPDDFIVTAAGQIASLNSLWPDPTSSYTHCIMNPPYKKIASASQHRASLRAAGIETVNLYSAFVALALLLLRPKGQLVAIIPRSFCNGPYYRPFRELLLKRAAIRRIHLFGARNKAFAEDHVLQENIILCLEKDGQQHDVEIFTSTDASFADLSIAQYPFAEIVAAGDRELFLHIPTESAPLAKVKQGFAQTLAQLGLQVSTGPVVDFRLKEHLRAMPDAESVPLLYPCHFPQDGQQWPLEGGKKPNAIQRNEATKKWLYPNGFYAVVRRFSAKEERRRIRANVVEPAALQGAEWIGVENHLNVFHAGRVPLSEALARGLAVFLNSSAVDAWFRRFSGHTQVNATDLKNLRYPERKALLALGNWAASHPNMTQDEIDAALLEMT